jgi:hypothetical protein
MNEHLNSIVYLEGMWQPLTDIAEILEQQNHNEHALVIREAIIIIDRYKNALVNRINLHG